MSDRFKTFWLGLFIIAALAGAAWLILFLRPSVGDNAVTLKVRFSDIERITIGTRVSYAGKPVGEVVSIDKIPSARKDPTVDEEGHLYIYQLTLKVDSGVKVYNYDSIVFSSSGLLGERSIAILPKPAPSGMPPPYEVTRDILYAESIDKIEKTLGDIRLVAKSLDGTLGKINTFIDKMNETELAVNLSSAALQLTKAMTKADTVFAQINDQKTMNKFGAIVDQLVSGRGTLSRLLYSDVLYCQLSSALWEVEATFSAINHYGLLFQFSRGWQRERQERLRACAPPTCAAQSTDPASQASHLVEEFHRIEKALKLCRGQLAENSQGR